MPQLSEDGSPRPMNCRPAAVSTAYSAAPRKFATSSDVIVGRISTAMMYDRRSPRTLADSRKSRRRSDSAWTRSCRAPYDQPVITSTRMSTRSFELLAYDAITMMSGNVGMTRKTSVTSEMAPSVSPPTYAAVTPATIETTVASRPTPTAMTIEDRAPQMTWDRMSWP